MPPCVICGWCNESVHLAWATGFDIQVQLFPIYVESLTDPIQAFPNANADHESFHTGFHWLLEDENQRTVLHRMRINLCRHLVLFRQRRP